MFLLSLRPDGGWRRIGPVSPQLRRLNTHSSPKVVFSAVRKGSRLMTADTVKHGNGGCFGLEPNFLFLLSVQLFNPYMLYARRNELRSYQCSFWGSSLCCFCIFRAALRARLARIRFSRFRCCLSSLRGGLMPASSKALGHGPKNALIATTSCS